MRVSEARFYQVVTVPDTQGRRNAVTHVTNKHHDLWFEYPFLHIQDRVSKAKTLILSLTQPRLRPRFARAVLENLLVLANTL